MLESLELNHLTVSPFDKAKSIQLKNDNDFSPISGLRHKIKYEHIL